MNKVIGRIFALLLCAGVMSWAADETFNFSLKGFATAETIDDIEFTTPNKCFVITKQELIPNGAADLFETFVSVDNTQQGCADNNLVKIWNEVNDVNKIKVVFDGVGEYYIRNVNGKIGITVKRYKVEFTGLSLEEKWVTLKKEKVLEGLPATPPEDFPVPRQYKFTGWKQNFSAIDAAITIVADYEERRWYRYFYLDYDGSNLGSSEKYYEGENFEAPEDPAHKGLVFKGWDKDLSDIKYGANTIVNAIFEAADKPVYNFTVKGFNTAVKASDVKIESPNECFVVSNQKFNKYNEYEYEEGDSDAWLYDLSIAIDIDDKEACVNDSLANIWKFLYVKNEAPVVLVNDLDVKELNWKITYYKSGVSFPYRWYRVDFLDYDKSVLKTERVGYGQSATAPEDPVREGYEFKGWDKEFSYIDKHEYKVNAVYEEIKTMVITFVDFVNKSVIDEVEAVVGKPVSAPEPPTHAGLEFVGWSRNLDNLTENTTVEAAYAATADPEFAYTIEGLELGKAIKDIKITASNECFLPFFKKLELDSKVVKDKLDEGQYLIYFDIEVSLDGDCADDSLVNIWRVANPRKINDELLSVNGNPAYFAGDSKLKGEILYSFELKNLSSSSSSKDVESSSSSKVKSSSSSKAKSSSSSVKAKSSSSGKNVESSSSGKAKSSSSSVKSSSSSKKSKSSSSKGKASIALKGSRPQFSVAMAGRDIQVMNARKGNVYAVFDMQGHVIKSGVVDDANFNMTMNRAGAYIVRVGSDVKQVNVK